MTRFRFLPPLDGRPGVVLDGETVVTAEYLTPAQAKNRAAFWSRKSEIDLLERLRAEAAEPEIYSDERGA